MPNPWMSLWLSAANSSAGAVRGFWTAELHRQQTAMANEMVRQIMSFWAGTRMAPIAGQSRSVAAECYAVTSISLPGPSHVMTMQETGVGHASASVPYPRLESSSEWRGDAMVHVVGLICGLAACVVLAIVVWSNEDAAVLLSLAVYGAGLLAMLGCSALYNLAGDGPRKALWRRLDHAAIFVMIAGTYTPFAVVAIGGAWGTGLLVFVWTVAAVGVVLKLLDPGRLETLSIAAYLLLGWTVLVAIDRLITAVSLRRSSCSRPEASCTASVSSLPVAPTALPKGDLARVRADGRRMPILRHPGRHRRLGTGIAMLHAASREPARRRSGSSPSR